MTCNTWITTANPYDDWLKRVRYANDSWINKTLYSAPTRFFCVTPEGLEIDRVIFNEPATIVLWRDGTKTVVKAVNEEYDPEKGLAMAICKKVYGNKGNYFEVFKKHLKNYEPKIGVDD